MIIEGAATDVWRASRSWRDIDQGAGIAWSANSGLTWKQKYEHWIFQVADASREAGSGNTFQLITPFGVERRFGAPSVDCAEVAKFLRMAFASW
jgi:hypothetical protein